jgi:hypothetical protein
LAELPKKIDDLHAEIASQNPITNGTSTDVLRHIGARLAALQLLRDRSRNAYLIDGIEDGSERLRDH